MEFLWDFLWDFYWADDSSHYIICMDVSIIKVAFPVFPIYRVRVAKINHTTTVLYTVKQLYD